MKLSIFEKSRHSYGYYKSYDYPVVIVSKTGIGFTDDALETLLLENKGEVLVAVNENGVFLIANVTNATKMGYILRSRLKGRLSYIHNKGLMDRLNCDVGVYRVVIEPYFDEKSKIDWFEIEFIESFKQLSNSEK